MIKELWAWQRIFIQSPLFVIPVLVLRHIRLLSLIILSAWLIVPQVACKKDPPPEPAIPDPIGIVAEFGTDMARYAPGETVALSLKLKESFTGQIEVNYKHLTQTVATETLSNGSTAIDWTWTPPTEDFTGYMVELRFLKDEHPVDYASTAVDVSSDWTRFPRYGFLSRFPISLSASTIQQNLDELNAFHINGLQFYDWQHKHHKPLKMDGGVPAENWQDIAKRWIGFESVKSCINEAHARNMAAMSYNLLYGVWEDYATDGVLDEWFLYNDPGHLDINRHELDDSWAQSDILVAHPGLNAWREYIFDQTDTVYQHLDFDGWHVDQLGDRGDVYAYNGIPIETGNYFGGFLNDLVARFPDKTMLMNAVNQYGQDHMLQSTVGFAYTEVWYPNEDYGDLADIILQNRALAGDDRNSVLAAYMNYDLADNPGTFNEPAVRMTDAVIIAFGGAHIELGEHMLGKEYFPNNNLSMPESLRDALVEYYDILTGYQNALRDGGILHLDLGLSSPDLNLGNWNPVPGSVSSFGISQGDLDILHLLNFDGLSSSKWRDANGTQTSPVEHIDFRLVIPSDRVDRIVYASPDWHDGVQQELPFTIEAGVCTVTIPYLHYWGILLVE